MVITQGLRLHTASLLAQCSKQLTPTSATLGRDQGAKNAGGLGGLAAGGEAKG